MLNGVRPATHSARTVSPLPRLALNGREAASFYRCDSFNSLELSEKPAFWEVATVLRDFANELDAAKTVGRLRQL